MVFCTEFLDGWWSWEPLGRSCVRCGWCCAHSTIRTVHTTHAATLKATTHPKTRCRKPYAATQQLMLLDGAVRTAPSAPHTRPTQRLSRPPPTQKLGIENHMLQLNIQCSWWWAYVPETCRAKNTSIKLPCCIKLTFHIISAGFITAPLNTAKLYREVKKKKNPQSKIKPTNKIAWHRVVWHKTTDVSDYVTASILCRQDVCGRCVP